MGEAGIWIAVVLVGVVALGMREYARATGSFAVRWEQVKFAIAAGAMILLGVAATILTVLFIAVIVLPEIWRPLLVVLGVFAVLFTIIYVTRRSTL